MRVLVIDTEVDLCLLIKAYYLRRNYEVDIAHDIDTALERIRSNSPDHIFLATNVSENPDEDIKKISEAAPAATLHTNDSCNQKLL